MIYCKSPKDTPLPLLIRKKKKEKKIIKGKHRDRQELTFEQQIE
jgi:hypothetical protein